jgi:hypothetical protein
MPNPNDQDPPVRSTDPFRPDKDNPASDELALSDELEKAGDSGDSEARQQAAVAGSGTTGHEVEPEPNDDMNLEGFDKKK